MTTRTLVLVASSILLASALTTSPAIGAVPPPIGDPCQTDSDGDQVPDCIDTCPDVPNPAPTRLGGIDLLSLNYPAWLQMLMRPGLTDDPLSMDIVSPPFPGRRFATGDMTGDGRADVVVETGNRFYPLVSYGDGLRPAAFMVHQSNPHELAMGDFTSDGKADLAWLSLSDANLRIARANADATLTLVNVTANPDGDTADALATAYFDGDGNLDVVTAANEGIRFYYGDGTGQLATGPSFHPFPSSIAAIVAADLDHDEVPDVAVFANDGHVYVFLYRRGPPDGVVLGPGCVVPGGCNLSVPGPADELATGDFNGDGDTDLVIPAEPDFMLYLGDGIGGFTPTPSPRLYATWDAIRPTDGCHTGAGCAKPFFGQGRVATGDFSGDGRDDVVLRGRLTYSNDEQSGCIGGGGQCTLNYFVVVTFDDAGIANPGTMARSDYTSDPALELTSADLDFVPVGGDSDGDGAGDACDLCPIDPHKTEPGACGCNQVESDANSDNDTVPDCLDDCPYDDAKTSPGPCGCGVDEIHSDNDGVPDCVDTCDAVDNPFPARLNGLDALFFKDSFALGSARDDLGPLPTPEHALGNLSGNVSIARADLDHDGDEDLAIGMYGPGLAIALNNGDGTFDLGSPSVSGTDYEPAGTVAGDFFEDGDGHIDVLMLFPMGELIVMQGFGDGSFEQLSSYSLVPSGLVSALASGDFDGNGHLDLAVMRREDAGGRTLQIYNGTGAATFTEGPTIVLAASDFTASLTARDLDTDGDLDLAAVSRTGIDILLNEPDGSGTFVHGPGCDQAAGCGYEGGIFGGALAIADLDGDGRLDLATGWRSRYVVYLGQGGGAFSRTPLATALHVEHPAIVDSAPCRATASCARLLQFTHSIAAGDLTGDGRDDVLVAGALEMEGGELPAAADCPNGCVRYVAVVASLDANGALVPSQVLGGVLDADFPRAILLLDLDGRETVGNEDGDALGSACEECDADPNKTEPGVCGCGVADSDRDGDGTPNCVDECTNDPDFALAGACGCGIPETDGDTDGFADCIDGCPELQTTDNVDSDGDGAGDDCDECVDDPDKSLAGFCGCGFPEDDHEGDGFPDCVDPDDDDDGLCDGPSGAPFPNACRAGPDVCPFDPNVPNDDADADGIGEACGDYDLDGDGTCDAGCQPGDPSCKPGCPSDDPALVCNGHGVCHAALGCLCDGGWGGAGCRSTVSLLPDLPCPGGGDCNGQGECDGTTGLCVCDDDHSGASCTGTADGQERGEDDCFDEEDNDGDGRIDCADPSCGDQEECLEECPVTACFGKEIGAACGEDLEEAPGATGRCIGPPGSKEGTPCNGECMCEHAFGIRSDSETEEETPFPVEPVLDPVCPCFDAAMVAEVAAGDFGCDFEMPRGEERSCQVPSWHNPGVNRDPEMICGAELSGENFEGEQFFLVGEDFASCVHAEFKFYFEIDYFEGEERWQIGLSKVQADACRELLRPLVDDDNDGRVPCDSSDCNGNGTCDPATGQCNCRYEDGQVYYDDRCSNSTQPEWQLGGCFNGQDDNNDQHIDCDDPGCFEECQNQCFNEFDWFGACRGHAVGDPCVVQIENEQESSTSFGTCYGGEHRGEGLPCFGECACTGGVRWEDFEVEGGPDVDVVEHLGAASGDACPCWTAADIIDSLGIAPNDCHAEDTEIGGCDARLPDYIRREFVLEDRGEAYPVLAGARYECDQPVPGADEADWEISLDGRRMRCDFERDREGFEVGREFTTTLPQYEDCRHLLEFCTRDANRNGVPDCVDARPAPDVPNLCEPGPDNCLALYNGGQDDQDQDGLGDDCDDCDDDPTNHDDGDELCANEDNCPTVANEDQLDLDQNDIGDLCEPDRDFDGVCDTAAFGEVPECTSDVDCGALGDSFFGGGLPFDALGCHEHQCRLSAAVLLSEGGACNEPLDNELAEYFGFFDDGLRRGHCEDLPSGLCIPGGADANGFCDGSDAAAQCDPSAPDVEATCSEALFGSPDPEFPVTCYRGQCVYGAELAASEYETRSCTDSVISRDQGGPYCRVDLDGADGLRGYCAPVALADDDCAEPDGGTAGCLSADDCTSNDPFSDVLGCRAGRCEPVLDDLEGDFAECNDPRFHAFFGPRCAPRYPDNDDFCGIGYAAADGYCPDAITPAPCTIGPDNCPEDPNADQLDQDGDRIGDACDDCAQDALNDPDEDGACEDADNCPGLENIGQADGNDNGFGDACDPDPDGDEFCEVADAAPECRRNSDCGFISEVSGFGIPAEGIGCHEGQCRLRSLLMPDGRCDDASFFIVSVLASLNDGVQETHCREEDRFFCVPGTADVQTGACTNRIARPECTDDDPDADAFCKALIADSLGLGEDEVRDVACIDHGCRLGTELLQTTGYECKDTQTMVNLGERHCSVEMDLTDGYALMCLPERLANGRCIPFEGCFDDFDCEDELEYAFGLTTCAPSGYCEPTVESLDDRGIACAHPFVRFAAAGPRCAPAPDDPLGDDAICAFGEAMADGSCEPDPRDRPCDGVDNCPALFNDQSDDDNDTIGDACDDCPDDPLNDQDGDGLCTGDDNCPVDSNQGQEDPDEDGRGVPCDHDDDEDGICDERIPHQCRVDDDCDDIEAFHFFPYQDWRCDEGYCRARCSMLADANMQCGYLVEEGAVILNDGVEAEFCCDHGDFCVPGGGNRGHRCDSSTPREVCTSDRDCASRYGDDGYVCFEGECHVTPQMVWEEFFPGPTGSFPRFIDPCNNAEARFEWFSGKQHCSVEVDDNVTLCVKDGDGADCGPECGGEFDFGCGTEEIDFLECSEDGHCRAPCFVAEAGNVNASQIDPQNGCGEPLAIFASGLEFAKTCCGFVDGLCNNGTPDEQGFCITTFDDDDDCSGGPDNCVLSFALGDPPEGPMLSHNPNQNDTDWDGIGETCDPCPDDRDNDGDHDGTCAGDDSCPADFNPELVQGDGQPDPDGDGLGIPCDPDNDEDGICDRPGVGTTGCSTHQDCADVFLGGDRDAGITRCLGGVCRVSCFYMQEFYGADCSQRQDEGTIYFTGPDPTEHCCDGDGFCVPGDASPPLPITEPAAASSFPIIETCTGLPPDDNVECDDYWDCYYRTGGTDSGYESRVACVDQQCLIYASVLFDYGFYDYDPCNRLTVRLDFFQGEQHCRRFMGGQFLCAPSTPEDPCPPECEPGDGGKTGFFACEYQGAPTLATVGGVPVPEDLACGEDGLCALRCDTAAWFFEGGCGSRGVGALFGWNVGRGCCGASGLCVDGTEDADGTCNPVDAECTPGPDNCIIPETPEVTFNPDQLDTDGDGRGDISELCDICPLDPFDDADGDQTCGDADDCPVDANVQGDDGDGDGLGRACDPDVDGDGYCNGECPVEGCGQHGDCVPGAGCDCDDGWAGVDCSQSTEVLIPCNGPLAYLPRMGDIIDANETLTDDNITALFGIPLTGPACGGRGVCNVTNGSCYCDPRAGGTDCLGANLFDEVDPEDVDAEGSCDDYQDNDLDGSSDCMDAGCAGAEACRSCATYVACNLHANVGDPCEVTDGNETVAGVCYGGETRDDSYACAGDCMCRFAVEIVPDENHSDPTDDNVTTVDIRDRFPLEFTGCPCFGEADLMAALVPEGEVDVECDTGDTGDVCSISAPRWANPLGIAVADDETNLAYCELSDDNRTISFEVFGAINLCIYEVDPRDDDDGNSTGVVVVMTEAQERACNALLEAWRTDVNGDDIPDAADPTVVRCPGDDGVPCGGNGLCNPETGQCFCDEGTSGVACDFVGDSFSFCLSDDYCPAGEECNQSFNACVHRSEHKCDNGDDDEGDGLVDCADPDCHDTEHCARCGVVDCNDGRHDVGDACDFMPGLFDVAGEELDLGDIRAELPMVEGRCYGGEQHLVGAPCVGNCACVGGVTWNLGNVPSDMNNCPRVQFTDTGTDTGTDTSTDGDTDGDTDTYPEGEPCSGGPFTANDGTCVDCDFGECECTGVFQDALPADFDGGCPCFSKDDVIEQLGMLAGFCASLHAEFPSVWEDIFLMEEFVEDGGLSCFQSHRWLTPWIVAVDQGMNVGISAGVREPLWGDEIEGLPLDEIVGCFGADDPGIDTFAELRKLVRDGLPIPDGFFDQRTLVEQLALMPGENLCMRIDLTGDLTPSLEVRRLTDVQERACLGMFDDCYARQPSGLMIIRDGNGNGVPDCTEQLPDVEIACFDVDNCPEIENGTQLDSDGDALGDVCDPCPFDADNTLDGIGDGCDDDEDDDLDPDVTDCAPFDPAINHDATEVCDGDDNECDTLVDAADPDMVEELCEGTVGVCVGAPKLCIGGSFAVCDGATFADYTDLYSPIEIECDGFDNDCDGVVDTIGPEVCDGDDNDCDGLFDANDDELVLEPCEEQDGVCAGAMEVPELCVDGVMRACTPVIFADNDPLFLVPETVCDAYDNDCDDLINEDFVEAETGCGVGECHRTGHLECSDLGVISDTCAAGTPGDEVCDGKDNDCDGFFDAADTDLELALCEDQDGECLGAMELPTLCVNGVMQECTLLVYALHDADRLVPETVCDAKDNDCDGLKDEDFFQFQTQCGVGECRSSGILECEVNGNVTNTCHEQSPTQEVCDGGDDDCDGFTDAADPDLLLGNCEKQLGECEGSVKVPELCVGGVLGPCTLATYAGQDPDVLVPETVCDAKDNDCDGPKDEDFFQLPTECGVGECQSGGILRCEVNGNVTDTCHPQPPSQEVCDRGDDDCDGLVDAADPDLLLGLCANQKGVCEGSTKLPELCRNGVLGECTDIVYALYDPAYVLPESGCDALDNDCDGSVDEDYVETVTHCGLGECAAVGVLSCDEDGDENNSCVPGIPAPDELCDDKDDDCDGVTDNGFPTKGTACDGADGDSCKDGVVTCTGDGTDVECLDGAEVGPEICDGIDNNCKDGIDEGCDDDNDDYCDAAMTCLAGGGFAPPTCTKGCGDCNDALASGVDVNPGELEICNDVDDDCDTLIDEGCDDDDDGWCDFAIACSGTPLTCGFGCGDCEDTLDTIFPSAAERCNSLDDNCNEEVDETFTTLGNSCAVGFGACRVTGNIICAAAGTGTACDAVAGTPGSESCNGEDDDCDGAIDEDYDLGDECFVGVGECRRIGLTLCVGGGVGCSASEGASATEVCDGKDNDCDGQTDEAPNAAADPVCAPLETQILTGPQRITASRSAGFTFINPVTPSNAMFDCSYDGAGWTACDGGSFTVNNVAIGSHVLLVRSRGPDGSVDTTPAFYTWTVDVTVPDTIIFAGPDDPSQSGEAEFFFGASVPDVDHYMCALDPQGATPRANEYVPCDPYTVYSGLADGEHSLWVYVVDGKGTKDPEPAVWAWTIDTSAPETKITEAPPAKTGENSAHFEYEDPTDSGVDHFECRLDSGDWAACDGGAVDYFGLAEGTHVFSVRSVDGTGVVDPTPATYAWTVDSTAPQTTIAVHPDTLSQDPLSIFGYTSNEAPVTFECAVDPVIPAGSNAPAESAWAPCPATHQVGPLPDGTHTIWVRSVDGAGNVDGTPATFTWTIDTRSPETRITSGPPPVSGADEGAIFNYADPVSPDNEHFECSLDGENWVECDGGSYEIAADDLATGDHTFQVRTCDEDRPPELACDPSPAIWAWTVTTSPCPNDFTAPTMSCTGEVEAECVSGGATLSIEGLTPAASDACGVTMDHAGGEPLAEGENPIVFVAVDGNGNTASCLTLVAVVDSEPPTITCPANVAVDNDPGQCGAAVAIGAATVSDGCDSTDALVLVSDAPAFFPVGVTTVTQRVVDGAGHSAECTQTVTVADVEEPTLTCTESVTVDAAADACAWEGALAADSSDNCGQSLELEEASGSFPVGERPVVFTALDEGGHKRSCTTVLTVRDVTLPVVTCGVFSGDVPSLVRATVTDACGATATISDISCVIVTDEGDLPETDCLVVARAEALEVAASPVAGRMRVSYTVRALDASDNLGTVSCSLEIAQDRDRDGVYDAIDTCPEVPDPTQPDEDGDEIGDGCDVCPGVFDPEQRDDDEDGIGDACAPDVINDFEASGGGSCEAGGTSVLLIAFAGLVLMIRARGRRAGR